MSPLEPLTKRQQAVFEFVVDKIRNRGYGPTVREIGEYLSIQSPNGVMCHLKALEKKGLIYRDPNKSRAIELTPEARQQEWGLPLRGIVSAGATSLAFEQQERIDFHELLDQDDLFVLQVKGDSMIEAQIADGDYVIVRRQKSARSGQMVVAQTEEGEATLKYWFPEKGRIRLQPANSSMEPIYRRDVQVIGVVIRVIRDLT